MNVQSLRRRDLRRLVKDMWSDPRCDGIVAPALEVAVTADAQSLDRAVIAGYLRHFPHEHPHFGRLRSAAEFTANRRDWAWRARGERWRLWESREVVDRLAGAITADRGIEAIRDAGLEGDLAQGALVRQAVERACHVAARGDGAAGEAAAKSLIAFFDKAEPVGMNGLLAYALLAPSANAAPGKDHKQAVSRCLVNRIGDPRIAQQRWIAIVDELRTRFAIDIEPLVAMLRRWLTDETFRAFFRIVRATTDRQDQWDEREAFWLGYLESDAVSEAWFAFGHNAERQAAALARDEDVQYARITGGGADPTHSSLIMTLGDLRIAEWSHNGAAGSGTATIDNRPSYIEINISAWL